MLAEETEYINKYINKETCILYKRSTEDDLHIKTQLENLNQNIDVKSNLLEKLNEMR